MGEREKVAERIKKKEQEIQQLEEQLKEAKVYFQALQDVMKLFPRDINGGGDPSSLLRPGSLVAQARDVILKHGKPMHVNDIVRALGREVTRTNQTGLSGSIAAYVRKGEIFTRPGPNTFGLVELEQVEPDPVVEESPPPGFGQDPPKQEEDSGDDIPF